MKMIFIGSIIFVLTGCVSPAEYPGVATEHDLEKSDSIFVESAPSGAMVLLNDEARGATPLDVELPMSEKPQRLKVMKEGFKPEEIILTPTTEDIETQKENMLINSTAFFGGVGLVAGLVAGAPVTGLLGGSALGLVVAVSQEEDAISIKYEYSPENINIKLIPAMNN